MTMQLIYSYEKQTNNKNPAAINCSINSINYWCMGFRNEHNQIVDDDNSDKLIIVIITDLLKTCKHCRMYADAAIDKLTCNMRICRFAMFTIYNHRKRIRL